MGEEDEGQTELVVVITGAGHFGVSIDFDFDPPPSTRRHAHQKETLANSALDRAVHHNNLFPVLDRDGGQVDIHEDFFHRLLRRRLFESR